MNRERELTPTKFRQTPPRPLSVQFKTQPPASISPSQRRSASAPGSSTTMNNQRHQNVPSKRHQRAQWWFNIARDHQRARENGERRENQRYQPLPEYARARRSTSTPPAARAKSPAYQRFNAHPPGRSHSPAQPRASLTRVNASTSTPRRRSFDATNGRAEREKEERGISATLTIKRPGSDYTVKTKYEFVRGTGAPVSVRLVGYTKDGRQVYPLPKLILWNGSESEGDD